MRQMYSILFTGLSNLDQQIEKFRQLQQAYKSMNSGTDRYRPATPPVEEMSGRQ